MMIFAQNDFVEHISRLITTKSDRRRPSRRFVTGLNYGRHAGPHAWNTRRAAVVVLLYRRNGQWYLPLTLRPPDLAQHAGQISLPGGSIESGESVEHAAWRELEEELRIPATRVQKIGRLSEVYVFVSNFLISPCVAVIQQPFAMQPNPEEVVEVLEIPLTHLVGPSHIVRHQIRRGGVSFSVEAIRFEQHIIWGATATILGELIELVELGSLDT